MKAQMINQAQNPNKRKGYDLEERTARFSEALVENGGERIRGRIKKAEL